MVEFLRKGASLAMLVTVAAVGAGACSAEPVQSVEDEDGPGATSGTGGAGTGGASQGGSGGAVGPCGTDCSVINTPDCYVSVCNEGQHAGPVGQCVVVPDVDGVACDDGMFCTTNDTCQAGVCTGGPPNDCGMTAPACEEIVCDEAADSCTTTTLPNGTACESTDLCQVGSTCVNGLCSGGTTKDCFFEPVPNDCHVAVCNPNTGMCEPVPGNEGMACTDLADLCTINKTCSGGNCTGGTPKDCSHLTMGCNLGICDTATGTCTTQAVMDGQLCDDLDACTTGEICNLGSCGNGTPVTTCSQTGDGCCPSNCTAVNDIDCACMTGSLTTPFNSNNGQDGNMFDIVALKNIEVQGFEVNIDGTNTFEIYYRQGSFVGHETSSTGWILAATVPNVVSLGANVPTPLPVTLSIQIPAGQTYGFYVTTTGGNINYTNGVAVGGVWASNSDLQVLEGIGKEYPFGGSYTPRNWNGILHYKQCGM